MIKNSIYLDYAATTPCDKRVVDFMIPYFSEIFGNPNSLHIYGQKALESLNFAREKVSSFLNAQNDEVIFTSGSTESNNIAICRVASRIFKKNGKNHIITLKTEHKSVLDAFERMKRDYNFDVTFLDVKSDGILDLEKLRESINEKTSLVSICFLNNETGVIQNVKEISRICHEKDVLLHIDATQAFGKIEVDVKDLDIDFMSASGHKIYGPKGVGILYFKRKHLALLKNPGANNDVEFGIRAGTIPVSLVMGFYKAAEICMSEMKQTYERISRLRDKLIKGLFDNLDELYINGSQESFYPGIIDISFRGVEGEALMMEAHRICVSSGSACTSNKLSISHVLDAMNIPSDIAQSSLRISIGRFTTEEGIDIAIEDLINATKKLREMSPVWEMIQNGLDLDLIFKDRRSHHEHEI